MTISSSRGSEKTIDQIILTAYVQAGLIESSQRSNPPNWAEKLAVGRDLLDSILDSLQAENLFARSTVLYNLPIVLGTHQYSLPSYALDVVGDAMFIDDTVADISQAESEYLVERITLNAWQTLSDKSSQDYPMKFCIYRMAAPLNIFLWPVPSCNGWLRLQIQRLFADTTVGSATVDLQVVWTEFLEWRLAYRLAMANSLAPGRCDRLNREAQDLKVKLRGFSTERETDGMVFTHKTPWKQRYGKYSHYYKIEDSDG